MTNRRMLLAVALAAVLASLVPSAAHAASVTIVGDDGVTAVPLDPPPTIRNMNTSVIPAFAPTEKRYSAVVTGPGGVPASTGTSCLGVAFASAERVNYQGNGTYTVTIQTTTNASDTSCTSLGAPQNFTFTIGAFTAVTPPAATLLTRKPGQGVTIDYPFQVELNPGADSTELRYALGAGVGPDGALTVPGEQGFPNSTTGTASINFSKPGAYTFVARATDFGGAFSPWSAPATIRVLAPFDFTSEPSFADSRGPSYRITGFVREPSAKGKIKVSIAKGLKGGKFRSLRTIKIGKKHKFTLRFRITTPGKYRLQYRYKGSQTVAAGFVRQGIQITRRLVF